MKYDYSFKKSLGKAAMFILQTLAMIVAITGFSDVIVWDLIVQYVKPVIGALSIGGAIAIASNFVKYNWLS